MMPATASSEPTERSMPAVMMVNVIPTAMMPITETWSRIRSALSQVRNSGMRTEKNATSRTSATVDPVVAQRRGRRRQRPPRSGCGAGRASLATAAPVASATSRSSRGLGAGRPRRRARPRASPGCGRSCRGSRAARRRSAGRASPCRGQPVDGARGPRPWRRRRCRASARRGSAPSGSRHQRAAEHHLLLVAAGERRDLLRRRRGAVTSSAWMSRADGRALGARAGRSRPRRAAAAPPARGSRATASSAPGPRAGGPPATMAIPAAMAPRGRADRDRRPSTAIAPASAGASPKSASATLGAPGADHAVEADDLARAGPRRMTPRRRPRARARDLEPHRRRVRHGVRGNRAERSRPTIARTSARLRPSAGRRGADHPAVAQHRDAVGDGEDLVQLVGDVDDRHALARRSRREMREQLARLADRERGGRLVEDQDARLAATAP